MFSSTPGAGCNEKWPGIAGIPVSHSGFPGTGVVHGSESWTPVGPGAPGPVSSNDPPVMKKLGTEGGTKALPVAITQPLASSLTWNGLVAEPGAFR
jgi:hypothetical protein